MRTRSWRRFKLQNLLIRRLKRFHKRKFFLFQNANNDIIKNPIWSDSIGTQPFFCFKRDSNPKWFDKDKNKYSQKRVGWYRSSKPNRNSFGTKERDKKEFYNILKEYGLR